MNVEIPLILNDPKFSREIERGEGIQREQKRSEKERERKRLTFSIYF